ncbi:hypothetical protein CHS0354_009324 [Potamilus streckersoni]|uniref:Uncharacterized protein n=1 Tax=Potamilus streckersoni TaxID=2493646 RepID=A0AAE0SNZ5_9BIVA|nr:hypothetical protein CHS0354_009324 [Potamilus streckersoni]
MLLDINTGMASEITTRLSKSKGFNEDPEEKQKISRANIDRNELTILEKGRIFENDIGDLPSNYDI